MYKCSDIIKIGFKTKVIIESDVAIANLINSKNNNKIAHSFARIRGVWSKVEVEILHAFNSMEKTKN